MTTKKTGAPDSAPVNSLKTCGKDTQSILDKQELKKKYLENNRIRFPNIPEPCRVVPAYNDKTANGLTRMVKDLLQLDGWQCERVSNTGRMIDRSKVVYDCIGRARKIGSTEWIPGTGTNGTSDLHAVIGGRAIKIEIKIGNDQQSEAQKQYQAAVEKAGAKYVIVRSYSQFVAWYKQFVKEEVKP